MTSDALPFLAALALKATAVLALAALAAAAMARASAAARHLVWCVAVACVLALPALSLALPAWELPLLPAAAPAAAEWTALPPPPAAVGDAAAPAGTPYPPAPAATAPSQGGRRIDIGAAAAGLAAAGVAAGLLWLALGFWGAARVGRGADVVRDPAWLGAAQDAADGLGLRRPVLLLRSRAPVMPATWGMLWPSVVLPAAADAWPEERRRAVLAHELAHVKRFDCLTQAMAQLACVLFWWHPGVWYAAKRLRVERERACDDLVLAAGARPSDYASHLLEVARTHRPPRLAGPAMVSMAKPSHLESRLLWVLDAARDRRPPSRRAAALASAAALLVVVPLAAMRAGEGPARGPATLPPQHAGLPAESPQDAEDATEERQPEELPAWIGMAAEAPAPIAADTPDDRRRSETNEAVIERLIEMRAVGVTPQYVAEMRSAGYPDLAHDQLVSLRAVGVTPAYLAELRGRGYSGISADELTGMRAVGVTPAYIDEMSRAGFGRLSAEMLTGMRAVGVTSGYLAELRRHGIVPRHAGEAKGLRAAGVTGAYAEGMRALGLGPLDAEALTGLRALGVTPEYVRELATVGLTGLSARTLSELRAHGVTAAWVREMEAAGLGPLTASQLVRLRASGVDRELSRSRRRAP